MNAIRWQFICRQMRAGVFMARHAAILFKRRMTAIAMLICEISLVTIRGHRFMTADTRIFSMTHFASASVEIRRDAVRSFFPEIRVVFRLFTAMAFNTRLFGVT
jgi:hypothetical protein